MIYLRGFGGLLGVFLIPLIIWEIFWKGWALWRAAKNESKVWFAVLLILNTAGILEILYIFVFSRSSTKASAGKRKK
jgi:hypothetical protein